MKLSAHYRMFHCFHRFRRDNLRRHRTVVRNRYIAIHDHTKPHAEIKSHPETLLLNKSKAKTLVFLQHLPLYDTTVNIAIFILAGVEEKIGFILFTT